MRAGFRFGDSLGSEEEEGRGAEEGRERAGGGGVERFGR